MFFRSFIVMEGHIFIDDVITPDTLAQVKAKLQEYKDSPSITVHIQSPGGSVYAGYNIYHALKLSGKPIKTIIEGEAQSMATFIALAGSEIEICDPSVFMIHNPSSELQGTADQFIQGASELRNIESDMVAAYAAKTKLPEDQIREMMKKTTTLNATQAKQMGFVDKVLGNYMKAVAIGKRKNMETSKLKKVLTMVAEVLTGGPSAIDLKTTDGKTVSIDSTDGEFVGKTAMVDGQPANGEYPLEDGRVLVCAAGVVTEVRAVSAAAVPPAPAPPVMPPAAPVQTAEQKRIAELEAQLAASNTTKAEIESKVTAQAKALEDIKKELEEEEKKTVGDDAPPSLGLVPNKSPMAMGPNAAKQKENTMQFLLEAMPWIRQYYPESEVRKYVSASAGPNMISILETGFNYTYPGILTTEIFYKPTLESPALADLFTIDQDIKFMKQYNLLNPLSKILKPYTGCDRVFNGNRDIIGNTTVTTKEFQVSESWCKDDFTKQLTGVYNNLAQEWLKTGNRSFDPSGTPINTIIDKILTDALRRDVFRRVSFAAGNSSDDDYNQIDGLWDRLIDSSGGSNYCVVRAGSALGTGTLAAGAALTALEAVYASSNILLKNSPNKIFWVTRSIWENYYNSLIGTGAVTEQAFENLQKGLTTLTYKGIPVKPVDLWDQFLTESDNPLFATTRHLILLTIKDNHILGVENAADLNKIEGWYERKDRKFYYEADMKLGYNYLHCDFQTIAY